MGVAARVGLRTVRLAGPAAVLQAPAAARLLVRSSTAAAAAESSMSQAPADLWDKIVSRYQRAQQHGAAVQKETRVELLHDAGVEFVIRVAAALKDKPKAPPPKDADNPEKKPQQNPFLPYDEEMHVANLSDTHTLLLNKFNVVPYHVLVVTREFQSQKDPLNARDLQATWDVLRAYPNGALAFYNCGDLSGRSQPHKHVQVVPLPFCEGQPPAPPIQPLVDAACSSNNGSSHEDCSQAPAELRSFPFRAYAVQLDPSCTPEQLEAASEQLRHCCQAHGTSDSFNVILTPKFMMAVPRRQECVGPFSLNSLAFAGTILAKTDDEIEFVKQTGPMNMLAAAGVPW